MTEETEAWLKKAEEDWLSARWLLEEGSPVTTPALFHMQQCSEKLLKALVTERGSEFEKRHDLGYLLSLARRPSLDSYADLLDELTPFAVEFRYPGDLPVFSRDDARKMLERVGRFREDILRVIESGMDDSES